MKVFLTLLALFFFSNLLCGQSSGHVLWYDSAAANWNEALPIGNGFMGAMVYGGVNEEHFQLNENTLYSGEPSQNYKNISIAQWV
jgi:alpha-L-fucosidase 2